MRNITLLLALAMVWGSPALGHEPTKCKSIAAGSEARAKCSKKSSSNDDKPSNKIKFIENNRPPLLPGKYKIPLPSKKLKRN